MRIRSATTDDAVAIASLVRALGYDAADDVVAARLAWFAASEDDVVQVAEMAEAPDVAEVADRDRVAGFVAVSCTRSLVDPEWFGRITALSVAPDHRRRGVGRQLVAAAERWVIDRGCTLLQVNSGRRPERSSAHAFYPALGFRDQHDHHVLYEKRLE